MTKNGQNGTNCWKIEYDAVNDAHSTHTHTLAHRHTNGQTDTEQYDAWLRLRSIGTNFSFSRSSSSSSSFIFSLLVFLLPLLAGSCSSSSSSASDSSPSFFLLHPYFIPSFFFDFAFFFLSLCQRYLVPVCCVQLCTTRWDGRWHQFNESRGEKKERKSG